MPGESEAVNAMVLDDYCKSNDIDHITLLKCDAEGHDLAVLRGGHDLLKRNAISLIQFEYNGRWVDSRSFPADAFTLLAGSGYDLGKVTPDGIEFYDHWDLELESFREANYLACLPVCRGRFREVRWWNS